MKKVTHLIYLTIISILLVICTFANAPVHNKGEDEYLQGLFEMHSIIEANPETYEYFKDMYSDKYPEYFDGTITIERVE